jgi:hypothetical protein
MGGKFELKETPEEFFSGVFFWLPVTSYQLLVLLGKLKALNSNLFCLSACKELSLFLKSKSAFQETVFSSVTKPSLGKLRLMKWETRISFRSLPVCFSLTLLLISVTRRPVTRDPLFGV